MQIDYYPPIDLSKYVEPEDALKLLVLETEMQDLGVQVLRLHSYRDIHRLYSIGSAYPRYFGGGRYQWSVILGRRTKRRFRPTKEETWTGSDRTFYTALQQAFDQIPKPKET